MMRHVIRRIPLVGREKEFAVLLNLFKKVRNGKGRVVGVFGPPGIGKTKLVYEFLYSVPINTRYLEVKGVEYLGSLEYQMLKNTVYSYFKIPPSSKPPLEKIIESLSSTYQDLFKSSPLIKSLLLSHFENKKNEVVDKIEWGDRTYIFNRLITLLLKMMASEDPLIIFFDDFQWIDGMTRNFIETLVKRINSSSIMVVIASRTKNKLEFLKGISYYTEINLSPLSYEGCKEFVKNMLRCEHIDETLGRFVASYGKGNPFYMEELVNMLLEGKAIDFKVNYAKLKVSKEEIPSPLRSLILKKIAVLDENQKRAIKILSAIGSYFPLKFIELLSKKWEIREDEVSVLMEKGFLKIDGKNCMFKHHLIKDILYNSISEKEKREIHKIIAKIIEDFSKERKEYREVLLFHYQKAGEEKKLLSLLSKLCEEKKMLGNYAKAEEIGEKYMRIAGEKALKEEEGVRVILTTADIKTLLGKHEEALKMLSMLKKENLILPKIKAKYFLVKSRVLEAQGKYKEAVEAANEAVEMVEYMKKIDKELLGECYHQMGVGLCRKGDYQNALKYIRSSLKIRKSLLGEEHPDVADSYNTLGGIYFYIQNYEEALKYFEQALDIRISCLGEAHPSVAGSYNNIANVYALQKDYKMALWYQEKNLNIKLSLFGEFHPKVAGSYNNIGVIYSLKGEYEKAMQYYKKALMGWKNCFGEKHPLVAECYANIGSALYENRKYKEASQYFKVSLKIWEDLPDKDLPKIGEIYLKLYKILSKQKREKDVNHLLLKAIQIGKTYNTSWLKEAERLLHSK